MKPLSHFLKDLSPSSTTAAAKATRTSGGGGHSSNTKREAVQLPKFSGDEKAGQAFLKYPIWLENWKSQILEYEEMYRASILMSHIDSKAQKKIIGLETKFNKAMEKLDKYYGDNNKVIQACTAEVRSHP